MAIREGRWDCKNCGTKAILGRNKICPNCGHPRPEGTKFYLPEDAPEITDAQQLAQAHAGADWLCEHCGASNGADREVCKQCGAAKGSSPSQAVKEYGLADVPRTGDETPSPRPSPSPAPLTTKGPSGPVVVIGFLVLLACIFFGATALLRPKEATVTVAGNTWERTVQIERLATVREEGWSVPAGGRLISQQQKIQRYDSVLDHYETRQRQVSERVQTGTRTYVCGKRDLGNGYFEDKTCTEPVYETRSHTESYQEPVYRQVPIFGTSYTYDIDKWISDRTERAAGEDREPYWPRFQLGSKEREGSRTETYTVRFIDAQEKSYSVKMDQNAWATYEPGKRYTAQMDIRGNLSEFKLAP